MGGSYRRYPDRLLEAYSTLVIITRGQRDAEHLTGGRSDTETLAAVDKPYHYAASMELIPILIVIPC